MVRPGCRRYTGVNHFGLRGREGERFGGRRERRPRVSLTPRTSHFITESAAVNVANAKEAVIIGQKRQTPGASRRGVLR